MSVKLTDEQKSKLRDKRWRMENLYKIVNKEGKVTNFVMLPEQSLLFDIYQKKKDGDHEYGIREYILKNRQIGITTFHCIYYLDEVCWNKGRTAAIIAHEREALEKIFRKIQFAWESMPDPFRPQANLENKRELAFSGISSNIYIALKVRSGTVNHLHVSEIAYIKDIIELKAGSFQTVPKSGDITIESTAAGINHFYHDWQRNKTSRVWHNSFFSWTEHEFYKSNGLLTGEHEAYLNSLKVTQEQKNWWYAKFEDLGGDIHLMKQEYPTNDIEAFRTAGHSVFSDCLGDINFSKVISKEENIDIYEEPQENDQYCLGADTSGGFSDGDASVFYIINSRTYKVAARYKSRKAPDIYARDILQWAKRYRAFVGIEVNNHGLAVINEIKDEYPDMYLRERRDKISNEVTKELGWLTSSKSKNEIIAEIRKILREKSISDIPNELFVEMTTFIKKENGNCEASEGCFDDEVLAFGITLMMIKSNPYWTYTKRTKSYITKNKGGSNNFKGVRVRKQTPSAPNKRERYIRGI